MPAIEIRYDRRRHLRLLALSFLLGTVAATVFGYGASQRGSLLGRGLAAVGVPPGALVFVLVEGLTTAGVLYAFAHILRRRHRIRLTVQGLEIEDGFGRYDVPWETIAATGECPGPLAGIRVKDRAPLLQSHQGTAAQRELLATREPVGGYDLVFTREELDCGIEPFLAAVN